MTPLEDQVILSLGLAASLAWCVTKLIFAAMSDWRTRSASDHYWWDLAIPAAFLVGMDPSRAFTGLLGIILGLGVYYGLKFGGADAKALMVTGFLFSSPALFLSLVTIAAAGAVPWQFTRKGVREKVPFLVPLSASLIVGLIGQFLLEAARVTP